MENNNQKILSLSDLPQIIKNLHADTIVLLADPAALKTNSFEADLIRAAGEAALKKVDIPSALLSTDFLEKTFRQIGDFKPDIIIMIGGGTVLDTGKMVNILLSYNSKPSDLPQFKPDGRNLIPMVAIPTTSGTGSEATHFAVLYKDNIKYSVADSRCIPEYVILAPELTMSMPQNVAISTGFDAFAQAIESCWSTRATDESKRWSQEALALIRTHFVNSVLRGTLADRAGMQKAAHLAGKAINIAQTTAAHAISYPMSSFFGIPHGLAVFLTLPSIFAFNHRLTESDCTDNRGVTYVRETLNDLADKISEKGQSAPDTLRSYFDIFSVSNRLSSYGIAADKDIDCILDYGFNPQRMKNNPRRVTRNDLSSIVRSLV